MADVIYLNLQEPDDCRRLPEQTITLDSILYSSNHDFDLYASYNEFQPCDRSLEDDFYEDEEIESTIFGGGLVEFSDHDSIGNADLLGCENQVNFVMDLFHQRVEQSQVMGDSNLVSDVLIDSGFGVIDGNYDVGFDGLWLDLDLGFGVERHSLDGDHISGFIAENYGDDDFFVERRVLGSDSDDALSTVSGIQPFENSVRMVGFGSDSEENGVLEICVHSDDEYHFHEDNDDIASITLCLDALQLEDHGESNADFEWEEVDGQVDEREVLSLFTAVDIRSVSISVSPIIRPEEEVSLVRVSGLGTLEWEVLLDANNLGSNLDLDHDAEFLLSENDDYSSTSEDEMMFGQFAENENPLMGWLPASKSVVENLPTLVLTKEDVENNNGLCAICKDDINVGEQAKQLPCSHRYHEDCIIPWLNIRNTCPVCRYEFPTADAE
ncbi:E3 ubiquitin-protein ligase RING1 [Quillaja saponaria]|uniref:RING-type E3 ubiquitin transferase n=1 Tax=Quillaja saponaria TaxID=32244 RepID=A0AAD7LET2_QUISA|nr:E3 ubiquitin-protein ligase RING1 [Quillaja saponaria]